MFPLNKRKPRTLEEIKSINELLIEFGKDLKGHATSNSNSSHKVGFKLYVKNFYYLLILDELIEGKFIDHITLRNKISHTLPREFIFNTYVAEIDVRLYDLVKRQIIEYKNELIDGEYKACFKITQKGIDVYANNNFHDLATTSFFGYQSYKLSKYSLITAISAISLSVMTLLVTQCKNQTISVNDSQMNSLKIELQNIKTSIDNKALPITTKKDVVKDTITTSLLKEKGIRP